MMLDCTRRGCDLQRNVPVYIRTPDRCMHVRQVQTMDLILFPITVVNGSVHRGLYSVCLPHDLDVRLWLQLFWLQVSARAHSHII
jgi:hypothetical protein